MGLTCASATRGGEDALYELLHFSVRSLTVIRRSFGSRGIRGSNDGRVLLRRKSEFRDVGRPRLVASFLLFPDRRKRPAPYLYENNFIQFILYLITTENLSSKLVKICPKMKYISKINVFQKLLMNGRRSNFFRPWVNDWIGTSNRLSCASKEIRLANSKRTTS